MANWRDISALAGQIRGRLRIKDNIDRADVDDWWTGYTVAVPAIGGSLFSVLYFGAGIWAAISVLRRLYPLSVPPVAFPFVLSGLAYGTLLFVSSVYHDGFDGLAPGAADAAVFLFAPLLLSRFQAGEPERAFDMWIRYAPLGCMLGFCAAIWQFALRQSVEGGAGNASVFGFVMAFLGTASLANLLQNDRVRQAAGTTGYAMAAVCIFLSGSRIMLPAIVAAPFVLYPFWRQADKKIVIRTLALFALLASVCAMLTWQFGLIELLLSWIGQAHVKTAGSENSLSIRLLLWSDAVAAIKQSPYLGYGVLGKMEPILTNLPDHISYLTFSHVHNVWLDSALSAGILAPIIVTVLLFSPLYAFSSRIKSISSSHKYYSIIISLIALLNSAFNTLFTHDIMSSIFVVTTVLVLSLNKNSAY